MIMITKANVGICRVTEEIVLLIAIKDIIEIDWRVGYLLKLKIIIRKYLNFQYWKTYIFKYSIESMLHFLDHILKSNVILQI